MLGLENGSLSLVDEEKDRQCWRREEYDYAVQGRCCAGRKSSNGMSVECSPDGSCIASVDRSSDNVKIWDLDGTEKRKHSANMGNLVSVKFSPRGTLIAITNIDGVMKMYDTKTHKMLWELYTPNMLYSLSFSGDSKFVAAVARCGSTHIRYALTGIEFKSMYIGGAGEFCPTDDNLIACTDGEDLALWNIETEEEIWSVVHVRNDYLYIQNFAHFSPDGKMIATVRQDRIRDAEDPESDTEQEFEEEPNYVVVVHADDGKTKFSLEHERFCSVYEAAFSPDGRQLACVGDKGEVRGFCVLWNTSDGNATYSIHVGCPVRSIAWVHSEMQRRQALAMVLHNRLGAGSKLGVVDEETLRTIAHFHELSTNRPEQLREFQMMPGGGNCRLYYLQ